MVKKIIFSSMILLFSLNIFASNAVYTDSEKNGLYMNIENFGTVKINTDVEFGFLTDRALYSSFGLETQLFRFSKVVLSVNGITNNPADKNNWLFKLDFAPLYNSIKNENKREMVYEKDSQGRKIYGDNYYFDWYKNLGDRIYYTGGVPLIEAYIGYKISSHQISIGRIKNIVGIGDTETFFRDDAKFSPMGYWLTKDLFSGVNYTIDYQYLELSASLYSGGNPTKGYSNYLGGIETPNRKSNNTLSHAGKFKFKYGDFFNGNIKGYIYTSYIKNKTGSTWSSTKKDGKRNALAYAHGTIIKLSFRKKYFSSADLFFQYNQFVSGLSEGSCQNDRTKKFKDIKQNGYFIGSEIRGFNDKISLGISYEKIDRFDFNIFEKFRYATKNPFKNSKQTSLIYHFKYKINSVVSASIAYHKISNPALFVSDILDQTIHSKTKFLGSSNKMKVSLTCTV